MTILTDGSTETPHFDARMLEVARYWDELRGTRPVPGRIDIRPSDITRHLSRISILEYPRAGTVRLRLVGANLMARIGMELRGMPFRALFDLDDRAAAMAAAEVAIATPAVTILSVGTRTRTGLVEEGHMLILPLSDTSGGLTRALALYSEAPGVASRGPADRGRMAVTGSWVLDIPETGRLFPPQAAIPPAMRRLGQSSGQPMAMAAAASMAEPQAHLNMVLPGREVDAAPYLRVIEGGRA